MLSGTSQFNTGVSKNTNQVLIHSGHKSPDAAHWLAEKTLARKKNRAYAVKIVCSERKRKIIWPEQEDFAIYEKILEMKLNAAIMDRKTKQNKTSCLQYSVHQLTFFLK